MPSATWNVGAPVIIGPMNGAMTYPPGFRRRHHIVERAALRAARSAANVANLLIPGKRHARLLLVANARTRAGLPSVLGDVPVEELVENGVDLGDFVPAERSNDDSVASMAFVGRLVDWKGVDLLLGALHEVVKSAPVHLGIFGDGPLRADLEHLTQRLGLTSAVTFHGFVPQQDMPARLRDARALVLPSLYECGGAVVLEAMALGLPVIATRWGGPADYLDATCGILVEPHSREQMIRDLARAMSALSQNAELRAHLGAGAREKALRYDWDAKIDRMLQLYARVAG
jgi:glycosyltransferase involved in cell wall biosynthesis